MYWLQVENGYMILLIFQNFKFVVKIPVKNEILYPVN